MSLTETVLPPPVDMGLPAKFAQWRPGQDRAIVRALDAPQRFKVLALPTGCVAGDTVVQIARGSVLRASRQHTIAREFEKQHAGRRQPDVQSYTRSLLDAEWIGAHPITGAAYSGPRETFALQLTNGRTLRATPDHDVQTLNGWVPLAALSGADHVVCDGVVEAPRAPKRNYRQVQGLVHHPYAGGASSYGRRGNHVEGRLYRVPFHRLVVEAHLNGTTVETLIRVCRTEPAVAVTLLFLDPREYAVHHLDRDVRNNAFENLEVLTHAEHQRRHGREEAFRHFGRRPITSQVAALARWGVEDTYDLVCADPHRNFVANGIVVHNSGKSLSAIAASVLVGGRTVILTSTKALAQQYMSDFAECGMVEVKGQNAYPCRALTEPDDNHLDVPPGLRVRGKTGEAAPTRQSCDEGPCHTGMSCKLRNGGCHYYDAVRAAEEADLVVTNYAFWLTVNEYRKRSERNDLGEKVEVTGIGKFDLLVPDEAHDAPEALSSFLTCTLTHADVEGVLGATLLPVQSSADEWARWATYQCSRAEMLLEAAKEAVRASQGQDRGAVKQVKALRQIVRTLTVLQTRGVEWVVEEVREDGGDPARPDLQFAPVWPAPLAEKYLFRDVPSVMLVSATVRPKTLDYLGIARKDAAFWEEPSTFPIARRPVYHIPTVKLTHRSSEMDLRLWLTRIGQIMRARPGVRGIIHTGSYERARYIANNLAAEQRRLLLWHRSAASWQSGGRNLAETMAEFRTRPVGDGLWLISPSVTTGYDFAGDACRVQIISKVPFPDTRSEVVKARTQRDPDYGMYLTAQTLVQAVGRSTRSDTDFSEVFILDDQVTWFIGKYGRTQGFAPKWFLEAYRSVSVIPQAPTWAA